MLFRTLSISVIIIGLAFYSGAASLSAALTRAQPTVAASMPIAAGLAQAKAARREMARPMIEKAQAEASEADSNPQAEDLPIAVAPSAIRSARQAFATEPLSDEAIMVLALAANAQGQTDRTRAIFSGLHALTRRNQVAALWLARDAAQREKIPETLKYFDEMLRSSSDARPILLARFAAATAYPEFRDGMAKLLGGAPPWADEFWDTAPTVAGAERSVAELRILSARSKAKFNSLADQKLASQLLNVGAFDHARDLYAALVPRTDQDGGERVRNADFTRTSDLPPIDWQTFSIGDYGSEIVAQDGLLLFSAINNPGGEVARQWVALDPGSYRLVANLELLGNEPRDEVSIRLTCFGTDTEQRRLDFKLADGRNSKTFQLSPGCRNYWLDIIASPAEGGSGFDGQLSMVSIRAAD